MKQSDTLYKYDNEYLKILYWCKIFINFFVSIVLSVKFYCGVLTALAIAQLLDALKTPVNRWEHPVHDLRQVGVYSLPVGVSVRRLKHNFQSMVVQKYKIYLTYPNFWGESY